MIVPVSLKLAVSHLRSILALFTWPYCTINLEVSSCCTVDSLKFWRWMLLAPQCTAKLSSHWRTALDLLMRACKAPNETHCLVLG